MTSLSEIVASLTRAQQTGRIGPLVAVHITLMLPPGRGSLIGPVAALLSSARGWLNAESWLTLAATERELGRSLGVLATASHGSMLTILATQADTEASHFTASLVGRAGTANWRPECPTEALICDLDPADPETLAELREALNRNFTSHPAKAPQSHSIPPAASVPPVPAPWGVLLIGGHFTHQPLYAPTFSADARTRIVAVADETDVEPRTEAAGRDYATELGVPYLQLDEALARPDIQIVSLCCAPRRRARLIHQIAAAGKHLYLDKPLCVNATEISEIEAALTQCGCAAQLMSLVRLPHAAAALACFQRDELGSLRAVHYELTFAKGCPSLSGPLRFRHESPLPSEVELPDAKRELTNIGIYPLCWLALATGELPRRVTATTGNYFFAEHLRHDFEDYGSLLLEYASGLLATVRVGRTGWQSHPALGEHRITLWGSREARSFDANQPRVEIQTALPPWSPPPQDPEDPVAMWPSRGTPQPAPKQNWLTPTGPDPVAADIRHFLDHLEQGTPIDTGLPLATACTKILTAAYHSAAKREPIEL